MSQLPKKWYVGYEQEYDIDSGDDGRTIGYPTGRSEFDGTVFEVDEDGDQIETVAEQIRDEKTAHLIAAAPEMLEALEAVEIAVTLGNAADDDPDAAREWLQAQTKAVELVEAVLKKVRGKR